MMARAMGRRGGLARARRLSVERRRQIASLGGQARRTRSLLLARRIADNLLYAAAIEELRGGPREIRRVRTFTGPLPGSTRTDRDMAESTTHLESVGDVVEALTDLGLEPVLVGGMALVVLGSRRVTRDFDFVVARPGATLGRLLDVFYDRGFELASRVNAAGDVTATIDNRGVAAARLRLDAPASAYFLNPDTGLRIDLLFDFPLRAATLARRAATLKARSTVLRVASEPDLLRLKKIARAHRSSPGDAEDIAFLEARRAKRRQVSGTRAGGGPRIRILGVHRSVDRRRATPRDASPKTVQGENAGDNLVGRRCDATIVSAGDPWRRLGGFRA